MKSLKQIINRYIRSAAIVMALVILVVIAFAEILIEQGRVEDTAAGTFVRLEQIIEENENELKQVKEKYDKTCLHDAEAIAFLLQKDPEATNDTLKLKKYANLLELDEIHIFDETGTIVSGTNPEYYGYSFSSGEQMAFFAPMLTDKSLQLVQDAGPNTAEGKNMQYSAVWSADGTFIVQVGKDPQLVTEAMEKNEISYIFHQLNISPAIDYCAVDSETLSVIGATNADMVGKTVANLGISAESMQNEEHGFHANIEGKYYYCIFKKIETRYMGFIIPMDVLYERIPLDLLNLALCLVLICGTLTVFVANCVNRYVIHDIHRINGKLNRITQGNLEEKVNVQSSREFSALSRYINEMVGSLVNNDRKMSYVLSRTEMNIGVYEYRDGVQQVYCTERIPQIFGWTDEETAYYTGDRVHLYTFIEELRRIQIESERDTDPLTRLYNRRGLSRRVERILEAGTGDTYAVVMIDLDDLKEVNDTYGHESGDQYIISAAEILKKIVGESGLTARHGGDEFVLFLEEKSEEALREKLTQLEQAQDSSEAVLHDGQHVPLRFSMGCCFIDEVAAPYDEMLEKADIAMYQNKRQRKEKHGKQPRRKE
ncbi:diguanylate cyclase domain-containing protein [Hominenteromicrobium sp.]|uniref:sensor domain-containing diguanylate cyclase n=1 Tax=Hominenteromicrobium sp. TaxID=3073581 RepID=UPI003AF07923